jgi:hypothetical protein
MVGLFGNWNRSCFSCGTTQNGIELIKKQIMAFAPSSEKTVCVGADSR